MVAPPCYAPDGLGYGDVSGDGDVSAVDTLLVMRYVSDSVLYPLSAAQRIRADVDGDGVVTQADANMINEYAVGARTTFPVCAVGDRWVTKTVTLSKGGHSLTVDPPDGYEPMTATFQVTDTGVVCEMVSVGICGGDPGFVADAFDVTLNLKEIAVIIDACTWFATQDFGSVTMISTLIKAFIGRETDADFDVAAAHISGAILYYLGETKNKPERTVQGNTKTGCSF